MLALTAMICLHFVLGELPTLGIYNTDTSRECPTIARQIINAARYERNIMHQI